MEFNALYELIWIGHAQRNRLIKFDSPLGKDWLVPLQARGTSRIGRDSEFIVDLASSRGEEIIMWMTSAAAMGQAERRHFPIVCILKRIQFRISTEDWQTSKCSIS
jgi:hypothetical protein